MRETPVRTAKHANGADPSRWSTPWCLRLMKQLQKGEGKREERNLRNTIDPIAFNRNSEYNSVVCSLGEWIGD